MSRQPRYLRRPLYEDGDHPDHEDHDDEEEEREGDGHVGGGAVEGAEAGEGEAEFEESGTEAYKTIRDSSRMAHEFRMSALDAIERMATRSSVQSQKAASALLATVAETTRTSLAALSSPRIAPRQLTARAGTSTPATPRHALIPRPGATTATPSRVRLQHPLPPRPPPRSAAGRPQTRPWTNDNQAPMGTHKRRRQEDDGRAATVNSGEGSEGHEEEALEEAPLDEEGMPMRWVKRLGWVTEAVYQEVLERDRRRDAEMREISRTMAAAWVAEDEEWYGTPNKRARREEEGDY